MLATAGDWELVGPRHHGASSKPVGCVQHDQSRSVGRHCCPSFLDSALPGGDDSRQCRRHHIAQNWPAQILSLIHI